MVRMNLGVKKQVRPNLTRGVKAMKKILLAAAILFSMMNGTGVQAQSAQENEKSNPASAYKTNLGHGRHSKKVKPVRKISGAAKRGAKQVSPLVTKKGDE